MSFAQKKKPVAAVAPHRYNVPCTLCFNSIKVQAIFSNSADHSYAFISLCNNYRYQTYIQVFDSLTNELDWEKIKIFQENVFIYLIQFTCTGTCIFFIIDHLWKQGMIVGQKESDPLQKLSSIFLVMKMMMISWMILKFQVTNLQAILSLAIDKSNLRKTWIGVYSRQMIIVLYTASPVVNRRSLNSTSSKKVHTYM